MYIVTPADNVFGHHRFRYSDSRLVLVLSTRRCWGLVSQRVSVAVAAPTSGGASQVGIRALGSDHLKYSSDCGLM
jgi:hypothetical protein